MPWAHQDRGLCLALEVQELGFGRPPRWNRPMIDKATRPCTRSCPGLLRLAHSSGRGELNSAQGQVTRVQGGKDPTGLTVCPSVHQDAGLPCL